LLSPKLKSIYLRAAARPFQALFLFWTLAWPALLPAGIQTGSNWRLRSLVILGYFALLALSGGLVVITPTEASFRAGDVVLPAWSGETPVRLASKWCLFNVPPTLLFVAFRYRRVRAVAPLVLSFVALVCAGILSTIAAAFCYEQVSTRAIVLTSQTIDLSVREALIGYLLLLAAIASLFLAFWAGGC
jgi:hypothetical protein